MAFENNRTCPSCGGQIPTMSAFCSYCGYELKNIPVSNSIQSFFEKLETIQNKEEKLSFISGFPIPNTKEDILEFCIMASSHIKPIDKMTNLLNKNLQYSTFGLWKGTDDIRFNNAWLVKIKQAYEKAKIVLANDKTALSQVENIVVSVEKSQNKHKYLEIKIVLVCIGVIIVSIILMIFLINLLE